MSQDIRRDLISRNLGIIPISHGQIYTFQITIPDSADFKLSLKRRQIIEKVLTEHQSNLVSLIVRRTNSYPNADIEYEVIYGADWLQIAQALGIEMVWAWVFDMTDEQATVTREEMAELFNPHQNSSSSNQEDSGSTSEDLIDQKLQIVTDSIQNTINAALDKLHTNFEESIKKVQYRLDTFNQNPSESSQLLDKIEQLLQRIEADPPRTRRGIIYDGPKITLSSADKISLKNALKEINTSKAQIEAAIRAIEFWQSSDRSLTWENLEQSARAKPGNELKVAGFANGTYERLRAIGEIEEQ